MGKASFCFHFGTENGEEQLRKPAYKLAKIFLQCVEYVYATSLLVLLRLAVAVSHLSLELLSRQHQVSGFLFHDII